MRGASPARLRRRWTDITRPPTRSPAARLGQRRPGVFPEPIADGACAAGMSAALARTTTPPRPPRLAHAHCPGSRWPMERRSAVAYWATWTQSLAAAGGKHLMTNPIRTQKVSHAFISSFLIYCRLDEWTCLLKNNLDSFNLTMRKTGP
jgi:hypothetical protein